MAEPLEKITIQRVVGLLEEFYLERIGEDKKGKITGTMLFREELGMDSLDRVEFHYKVEEELEVFIPEEDAGNLANANDYADYIEGIKKGILPKRRAGLDDAVYDIIKD